MLDNSDLCLTRDFHSVPFVIVINGPLSKCEIWGLFNDLFYQYFFKLKHLRNFSVESLKKCFKKAFFLFVCLCDQRIAECDEHATYLMVCIALC